MKVIRIFIVAAVMLLTPNLQAGSFLRAVGTRFESIPDMVAGVKKADIKPGSMTNYRTLDTAKSKVVLSTQDGFKSGEVVERSTDAQGRITDATYTIPELNETPDIAKTVILKEDGSGKSFGEDGNGLRVRRQVANSPLEIIQGFIAKKIDGVFYRKQIFESKRGVLEKEEQIEFQPNPRSPKSLYFNLNLAHGRMRRNVDLSRFDGEVIGYQKNDSLSKPTLSVYVAKGGEVHEYKLDLQPNKPETYVPFEKGDRALTTAELNQHGFLAQPIEYVSAEPTKSPRGMETRAAQPDRYNSGSFAMPAGH